LNKLAIIGAGNAGCITALHFKKYAPTLEIDLYHDSKNNPIELVGQGTTIGVSELLSESFIKILALSKKRYFMIFIV